MKLSLKEHGVILAVALLYVTLIQVIWPSPSVLVVILHYASGVAGTYTGYMLASWALKKGNQ